LAVKIYFMLNRLRDLLFQNISTKQTILKNVFWLSASQIGSRLIRAAIIIYAARVLGAAEYGVFSYILGLAGFFTIFADLGLSPLMTREIASQPEKRSFYFTNAFWIKVFLLFITSSLIIFVAPRFSKIEAAALLVPFVAILVILDNFRDLVFSYFRGVEKMEKEAILTIIMNTIIAIAGFIILYFSRTAGALLFSYIASVAALSIVAFYFVQDLIKNIFKNFNKEVLKKFIHDCWPLAFAGLFGVFMLNIDIIMLGWWRTAEEIGYYSAGQRIIQILYTLPAISASAVFPALSRFISQNQKEKTRLLSEKSITILYLAAFPLTIGGIVLSAPIMQFLFGREYLPGALAFQLLCIALLINFPGAILSNLILARNQQKSLFKYLLAGSSANVLLNALLIPLYGIAGSAAATVFAQSAYYVPIWHKIKGQENFYTLRYLKKIIAAAAIMGVFTFVINKTGLNVIINIILSAGVYFGILYFLKENVVNEIRDLFVKIKF